MLTLILKYKEPKIAKAILKRKSKVRGLLVLHIKIYYKATVNQGSVVLAKRYSSKISRIE